MDFAREVSTHAKLLYTCNLPTLLGGNPEVQMSGKQHGHRISSTIDTRQLHPDGELEAHRFNDTEQEQLHPFRWMLCLSCKTQAQKLEKKYVHQL